VLASDGTATAQLSSLNGGALSGARNRIINGDMRIDARNAGASVTPTAAGYTLDRWTAQLTQASKFSVQQNAGSVTLPAGFTNYLGCTSLSAYSVASGDYFRVDQFIEGFNVADLAWGTANASTVTLSFRVRSSLTGTFGGVIANSAFNRCYPFSYTVSSANTWTTISVSIPGDTTGTWLTDNGIGIRVSFSLGAGSTFSGTANAWSGSTLTQPTGSTSVVGTNGATFYITGVQLEAGSVATLFERRSYGQELALCQRYYEKSFNLGTAPVTNVGVGTGEFVCACGVTLGNSYVNEIPFKASKRTTPTVTLFNRSNASNNWQFYTSGGTVTNGGATDSISENSFRVNLTGSTTSTIAVGHYAASAEL
jgi:hypothetical protein